MLLLEDVVELPLGSRILEKLGRIPEKSRAVLLFVLDFALVSGCHICDLKIPSCWIQFLVVYWCEDFDYDFLDEDTVVFYLKGKQASMFGMKIDRRGKTSVLTI